jgi:creatinine amidohydrolase
LLLAIPLGSTEQHGPHLPLSTDTSLAVALASALAARRPDVVVAPALPYGSSGEHAAFPGTLSIGQAALELVIVELVRSADRFAGVVLVNGHGGNAATLARAGDRLSAEGRAVLLWSPRVEGLPGAGAAGAPVAAGAAGATGAAADAHAGRIETSLMLAVAPDQVRLSRAEAGALEPLASLLPRLRSEGVAAVSPNGVLGDPAGASEEEGRALLELLADDLARAVAARWG